MLQVVQVLSPRTKNSPVLIGEAGVGKTAVVEGLAQRIAEGTAPGRRDAVALSLGVVGRHHLSRPVRGAAGG